MEKVTGFLCRDERRELMLELCGPTQPLRLNNGPRAFAVAARRGAQSALPRSRFWRISTVYLSKARLIFLLKWALRSLM